MARPYGGTGCCQVCQQYNAQTVTTLKPPLHKGCTCSVRKGERLTESTGDDNIHSSEDTEWLRIGYNKAVEKGDISALTGFEQYQEVARRIDSEVVGIVTSDGVIIKGYVTHFIDRVIGSYEQKREPVSLEMVKECLTKPLTIVDSIRTSSAVSREYNIRGFETAVNPTKGLLIQTGIRRH